MVLCVRFSAFLPPGFNHDLGFLQRQKPVLVQTLLPKLAVEALDKGILDWFLRLNKVALLRGKFRTPHALRA